MGPRRRTPGLRRSELATLAGVSVDYLIRLEQGRDTNPSAAVVTALADALRLGAEDRVHLKRLAAITQNPGLCDGRPEPATEVRPTILTLLDRLAATPALVLNDLSDLLAWTPAYEAVGGPVGILDGSPPNLLRFTFGDHRARTAYPDWDRVADDQVANLRAAFPVDDHAVSALVDELADLAGDGFLGRWARRSVNRKRTGTKRIVHPAVGELRLAYETMTLSDEAPQRLVVYFGADDQTAGRLDRLAGRHPGGLHAVGDASSA
jgi:transcriptional regulator with XRE-family HTH domain